VLVRLPTVRNASDIRWTSTIIVNSFLSVSWLRTKHDHARLTAAKEVVFADGGQTAEDPKEAKGKSGMALKSDWPRRNPIPNL